jgi:RsiW-degrading membrane proteinase PrsW (M82 family)
MGLPVSMPPYPATLLVHNAAWSSPHAYDEQVPLFRPETHIGRLLTNDVVLDDPTAARMHAVIRWTPTGYEIEDLGSAGGTRVEGRPISGPTPLAPDQEIAIGQSVLTFHALAAQRDPAARPTALPAAAAHTRPFEYRGSALPRERRRAWLARQRPKHFWRVLLVGGLGLLSAESALGVISAPLLIGLVVTLGAALMPIAFLTFCWDQDFLADMPVHVVALTFISGALLGFGLAFAVEALVVSDRNLVASLEVGLIEETAKALAVFWFLRNQRLHNEIDGLILGAAAGAGFAILETVLYALTALRGGFGDGGGIGSMNAVLLVRGLLAIFGHVTWTAIVVAAIWRERGQSTFRLNGSVLLAFAIAVALHTLWDGAAPWGVLFDAVAGIVILRFFVMEAVAREELGSLAPPPEPLGRALLAYLRHPRTPPVARPSAPPASAFAGQWRIAPAGAAPALAAQATAPAASDAPLRVCRNGHLPRDGAARACPVCGQPLRGVGTR